MKSAWFGSALAGLLATTAAATGQSNYSYLLTVDYGPGESSIHEDNPDATIRVWATREDGDYAWARGNLDMIATEAGWSAFNLVGDFRLFGGQAGTLSSDGRSVTGIICQQFGDLNVCFERERPTLIWEGVWQNTSLDWSAREVELSTANTTLYQIYPQFCAFEATSRLDQFVPGAGAITITPAPGAIGFTLLAGASFGARRRRRP